MKQAVMGMGLISLMLLTVVLLISIDRESAEKNKLNV